MLRGARRIEAPRGCGRGDGAFILEGGQPLCGLNVSCIISWVGIPEKSLYEDPVDEADLYFIEASRKIYRRIARVIVHEVRQDLFKKRFCQETRQIQ